MSDNKYYAILTDLGQQLITEAYQAGTVVTVTRMAFGDANQAYVAPDPTMTALVNQTAILPLVRGPQAEDIIGGGIDILSDEYPDSWIYEAGLFDDAGNLIIYAAYPPALVPASTDEIKKGVSLDIGLIMSSTDNITVYVNPEMEALTRAVADTLYLQLIGGAMTGPIGFSKTGNFNGYALNRQAPDSLLDVYNPLSMTSKLWNKIGVIDATKSDYGRVAFTIIGSNSHDVAKPVQAGYATIDIIGTTVHSVPGMTLTFYKPDEAQGTAIIDAVLSANSGSSTKFDVWVLAQGSVAGLMMMGAQTVPGYFTLLDTPETSDTAPVAVTETGKVYLVSANKDGDVNIGGNLKVNGATNQNGDVNISAGHAVYSKSPFLLETDDPTGVPDGEFITTPVVKFRLNGRGALDDPEGAFANIYYEEHVGIDNALCIALNGFGGNPVMRIVNSSTSDSSQSSIWFPGSVCPGNYWNFDERYLGAGTAYVQNVRQGGQGSFLIPQGVDIFAPDGCYFMGYHAEGDKAEDDTFFYRPIQIKFNGAWSTIGYNTASPDPQINVVKSGRKKLTNLNNLMMYRPDENWPVNLQNFIDDSGYLWSDAAKNLSGNIFIAYDADGVIRYIEQDATAITPLNLSVAGQDSVPDDCSIDGTWIFDGEKIYQDVSTVNKRLLARNTNKRDSLAAKAVSAITCIQSSAAVGNPRNGDPENLLALQQYIDQLRDVNLAVAEPDWPVPPSILV